MREGLLLGFTFLVCLLYWWVYDFSLIGIDDAQIYFVYFRNFAEGHGFVYNPYGERVEGFTSLLWTLIGAAFYKLTPQHFPYLLLIFNVILCYFTFSLFNRAAKLIWPSSKPYAIFLLLGYIVLVPGYIEWNVLAFMETGLWTLLLTAVTVLMLQMQYERQPVFKLCLLLMLLTITRPESMLWGAFILLMFVLVHILQGRRKVAKPALAIGVTFGISLIGLLVFRLLYFGFPFPNTYYAKVSGDVAQNVIQGVKYLFYVMEEYQLLCIFLLISLLSLGLIAARVIKKGFQKPEISAAYRNQLFLSGTALLSYMIHLYTGGDHFGMARMFQPFIPVYFLMLMNVPFWQETLGISITIKKQQWLLSSSAVMAVVLLLMFFSADYTLPRAYKHGSPLATEILIASVGISEGERLSLLFSKVEKPVTIGVSAAGGFAWAYKGPVLDLMGLNNTAMAHANPVKGDVKNHASFDVKTLLKLKPEVFHAYSHGGAVVAKFHDSVDDAVHPMEQSNFKDRFVNQIFKGVFFEPAF
ncbi:MAG: hypothetical protein KY428_10055, partial [Bacteroidetes bacterium]|nr:hypothetical protein [Bacteroidota bacterium]